MIEPSVLASIPLFASLGDAEREQVACWFTQRSVSAGTELASEGASGYQFYVLLEGGGLVSAHGTTVGHLGPGDFFGEGAIVADGRRHASVTIDEPSEVLVMFGTEFRRLQQAHPAIAAQIDEIAHERLSASG